jgi:hypothetical protein
MPSTDNRLDRLMAYTTFHIGVYVTLSAAIIAGTEFSHENTTWKWSLPLFLFIVSGAAGGIIAGNITELQSWEELVAPHYRLLVFYKPTCPFWVMAMIEHCSFWLGALLLVGIHVFSRSG